MKFKKLLILIVILFAIIVVSFIKKANLDKNAAIENQPPPPTMVTQEIAPGFVSKLLISKGSEEAGRLLTVSKNGGGEWVIDSHFNTKARKSQVESVLKNLSGLKGEFRSDSKDVLEDYSLLETQAYHLELQGSDNQALAHVLVSPLRTRGTKNFVRNAKSSTVVVTDSDILTSLGLYSKDAKLDYKMFADFKVVVTEASKIQSLELTQPKSTPFLMTKREDVKNKTVTWISGMADKEITLETGKVNELISNILNLYAKESADPAGTVYGFNEKAAPWIRIQLKPEEKPNEIMLFLGLRFEATKTYFLKSIPDGQVYALSDASIDAILKKNSDSFLTSAALAKKS
ncbi:MAG: hypothetical protein COT00_03145 [Candidatus Omnitrophica bacterium CG07_land_8_20_14_0_80_50_8]|nr:MAG: hypothetical protein COT00_03145 [Candidatus Omnitrophica bacterium CG07_land_8_20_14_0_80_50_8]